MLKKLWKEKRIWVLFVSVAVLLLGAVIGLAVADKVWKDGDRIAGNVFFLGKDLGHLTKEEAYEQVHAAYQEQMARKLHLTGKDLAWDFTLEELGLTDNSDVVVTTAYQAARSGTVFDRYRDRISLLFQVKNLETAGLFVFAEEKKGAILNRLSEELGSTAQDARFEIGGDHVISIVPSATGTALNTEKSWALITAAVDNLATTEVALRIEENMEPEVTTADLEAMDITTLIASFSTKYNAGQVARSENLAVASKSLDLLIVKPGETVSFNDIVGERTAARGFKQAIIIENGEFTPGMGGGVCQVSTTLYGALIRSELLIVERNPHSIPIAYVKPGQDAMVAWGSSDLKFKNEYDTPVLLHTECGGGTITMMVFGAASYKKEVEIVSEVLRYIPFSTETRLDKSLQPGTTKVKSSGNRGLECKVYKKILEDGEVVSTKMLSHNTYRAEKRVVLQGPAVVEEPKTPAEDKNQNNTEEPAA